MKDRLDFIVIGAQKCGTTSLFEYLRRHPQLCLPAGKEAPFFSHDDRWSLGWDVYVGRNFGFARPDRLWGTVTPQYMFGSVYEPGDCERLMAVDRPEAIVPERIHQHSADVKLVAVLRDPVARAQSHYRMEVMRGSESRPFDEAVTELLEPETLELTRRGPTETTSYLTTGEYGRILAPYYELFGPAQMFVCFTADLEKRAAETVRSVLRFLGVAPDVLPGNLGVRYRAAGTKRRVGRVDLYRVQESIAANGAFRAAWHALPSPMRSRTSAAFNEVAYRLELANRTPWRHDGSVMSNGTELALRRHYEHDRKLLRDLVSAEPPW